MPTPTTTSPEVAEKAAHAGEFGVVSPNILADLAETDAPVVGFTIDQVQLMMEAASSTASTCSIDLEVCSAALPITHPPPSFSQELAAPRGLAAAPDQVLHRSIWPLGADAQEEGAQRNPGALAVSLGS